MIFCIERDYLDAKFNGFGSFMNNIITQNLQVLSSTHLKDKPYVTIHVDLLNQLTFQPDISEYFRLIIRGFSMNLAFSKHTTLLIQNENSYVVQSTNITPPECEASPERGSSEISDSPGESNSSGSSPE